MERKYPGSLHTHTEYSNTRLRDCIIKIDDAMTYAEELGHEVIAFTDHDFTGSWVKIEKARKKHPNLKVILGNEIYLCRNGLNSDNFIKGQDRYYHFILFYVPRMRKVQSKLEKSQPVRGCVVIWHEV